MSTLLTQPWDRGNPRSRRPTWSSEGVRQALDGIRFSVEHRMKQSPHDGVHHEYVDVRFDCGCEAIADRGWAPCSWSFHRLLAEAEEASAIARRYFRLRNLFDATLEQAWLSHPMSSDEEAAIRSQSSPHEYRRSHDIGRSEIWTPDGLEADLAPIPLEARLNLYNLGSASNVDLGIQLTRDTLDFSDEPEALEMPTPIDVSEMTAEEIQDILARR